MAPGITIYYAAVDPWDRDARTPAEALRWIVSENHQLPVDKKIRAVVMFDTPYGSSQFFIHNHEALDSALVEIGNEGILILADSCPKVNTASCSYNLQSPDTIEYSRLGLEDNYSIVDSNRIFVPTSARTVSTGFRTGYGFLYIPGYYTNWNISYFAGVIALGWQVRPELSSEVLITLTLSSAYVKNGKKIINPTAFIDSVTSYHR